MCGLIAGQGISRVPGPIGRLGESDPDAARLQAVIRDYVRPGDTLSVWGWMPQYYPMTGLRQATREAHTQHQLTPGPRQESNRARYLGDLRSHPPAIFIDATGPGNWGFAVTVDFGYETFPALARWLGLHYRTVGLFNGGRILARRDRVFAADPSAAEIVGAFPAAAPAPAGWRGTKPYALGPVEAATTMAHAPCTVFWDPFASAQLAQFRYGILPGGFTGEGTTDGVVFRILALNHERGAETVLFERYLRPLGAVEDRSEQVAEIRVPAGMSVAFETDPGPLGSSAFDWAYWRGVRFESIRH